MESFEEFAKRAKIEGAIKRMKDISELYGSLPNNLTLVEKNIVENFENHLKRQIEVTLRKDYENIISEPELQEIIEKAKTGV